MLPRFSFLLGITMIIDMGTGVNAQIIATSTYWKFELIQRHHIISNHAAAYLCSHQTIWHYRARHRVPGFDYYLQYHPHRVLMEKI